MIALLSFSKAKILRPEGLGNWQSYLHSWQSAPHPMHSSPPPGGMLGDERRKSLREWGTKKNKEMPCLKDYSPSLSFEFKMFKPGIYLKTRRRLRNHPNLDLPIRSHCSESLNPSRYSHFKRQKGPRPKHIQGLWKQFHREAREHQCPLRFLR